MLDNAPIKTKVGPFTVNFLIDKLVNEAKMIDDKRIATVGFTIGKVVYGVEKTGTL